MKIHIGSDHAGLEFKAVIIAHLKKSGHDVTDHGPHEFDSQDDYPVFCIPTALATAADPSSFGIVLGGSGNGEQIAANKVKGVRAVSAMLEGLIRYLIMKIRAVSSFLHI